MSCYNRESLLPCCSFGSCCRLACCVQKRSRSSSFSGLRLRQLRWQGRQPRPTVHLRDVRWWLVIHPLTKQQEYATKSRKTKKTRDAALFGKRCKNGPSSVGCKHLAKLLVGSTDAIQDSACTDSCRAWCCFVGCLQTFAAWQLCDAYCIYGPQTVQATKYRASHQTSRDGVAEDA